jgi:undecaprenyl-diphosphatase
MTVTDFVRVSGMALRSLVPRSLFTNPRPWLWASAGATLLWAFVEVAQELGGRSGEARLLASDVAILQSVAGIRSGWITGGAFDVTALGSVVVLTLLTVTAVIVLLALPARADALQVALAAAGSGIWIALLKHGLGRDRPTAVPRLVEVTGFSFPSGHTLAAAAVYATIAIVVGRRLPAGWARGALLAMTLFLVGSVAASRVYLGVHYPSDVLAGVLFGLAWAFLLNALRLWAAPPPAG